MNPFFRRFLRWVPPQAIRLARGAWYYGHRHHCPLCGGTFRTFLPKNGRKRAMCPSCHSLERHRLLWLYLERETDLFKNPQSLLHFAPEPGLRERFLNTATLVYRTADIAPGRADDAVDIVAMPYEDESYDAVLCCHVLEHIPEDAAALREINRVLKPGGRAYLQVPIQGRTTDEDPSVTDPELRLQRFGQEDHVRLYGLDFLDRLLAAGFEAQPIRYWKKVALGELERCRLLEEGNSGEILWLAIKRGPRTKVLDE